MEALITQNPNTTVSYKAGETVTGTVIDLNPYRALLELPGGLTGLITKKEATGFGTDSLEFDDGEQIEALIIDAENDNGLVILSLKRASQEMVWAELAEIMQEERIITVKIEEANKGGLMASYKGLKAFLPVSQLTPLNYPRVDGADTTQILEKLQKHIGKDFAVRVINVDRENGKVIISEKAAHAGKAKETLKELNVGDVMSGEVSGVVKFGIFITFGGVEGLVHLSELDWGHVSDPGKLFKLGDKTDVQVIGIDGDKLSLSIKRLSDDPWLDQVKEFSEGAEVEGKVVRWNPSGVFIEVKPDVQGLFSLDQFGVEDHSELKIKEGKTMSGKILAVNSDSHRLELERIMDVA